MSFTKKDRNDRTAGGKIFPDVTVDGSSRTYAETVAIALKREFSATPSALKSIARITGANERSVKNWWTGKNGPSGEHLVTLTKHSGAVLEAILLLAGRQEFIANKKASEIRRILANMVTELDELIALDEEFELEMNRAETAYFSFRETEWPEIQSRGEDFLVPRLRQIVVPSWDNA